MIKEETLELKLDNPKNMFDYSFSMFTKYVEHSLNLSNIGPENLGSVMQDYLAIKAQFDAVKQESNQYTAQEDEEGLENVEIISQPDDGSLEENLFLDAEGSNYAAMMEALSNEGELDEIEFISSEEQTEKEDLESDLDAPLDLMRSVIEYESITRNIDFIYSQMLESGKKLVKDPEKYGVRLDEVWVDLNAIVPFKVNIDSFKQHIGVVEMSKEGKLLVHINLYRDSSKGYVTPLIDNELKDYLGL